MYYYTSISLAKCGEYYYNYSERVCVSENHTIGLWESSV